MVQTDERVFHSTDYDTYYRATLLMNNLLDSPDAFFDHIRRFTASVASTLVYGQRASTIDSFWAHVSVIIQSS